MKQIIQDIKNGTTLLIEVPAPQVSHGKLLIKTTHSLISLGTERMLVDFGKASYINKARQQPEKVKMVLDKIKTDGLKSTMDAVKNKLEQPLPMGYCNVGEVIDIGEGVTEFAIGDRVASNGSHAEIVCVPKNLVSKIPNGVSNEEATFTVIGSIGLQGIRLLQPQLGETVVVIGLGLIGLVTCQLLKANGCRVIGIDLDQSKCDIAKQWGLKTIKPTSNNPVKSVLDITNGTGADGVLITASTNSNDVIAQSAQMSRKRGKIVLIGVVNLDINRADFYEKELSFQISCSYGPGRYDDQYEQKGIDYPLPYVRWTEKRNFDAILNSIKNGSLNVKELITEQVKLENYSQIYGNMKKPGSIASILEYNQNEHVSEAVVSIRENSYSDAKAVLGLIGAGDFTGAMILPCLANTPASLKYIASLSGLTATTLARKFNVGKATSDYRSIMEDSEVDTVVITTRHNLHAPMVIEALKAGKNIFVEKPLALNNKELDLIISAYSAHSSSDSGPTVMVGFNRRFAPLALKIKELIGDDSEAPINIVATINAGAIPPNIWIHDPEIGGGRIIGEACHFIDLCSYLTGSKVAALCMNAMGLNPDEATDNASIVLKYEDGSNAVINYFANGSKAYAKEKVEVFSQQKVLKIDNWRKLTGYGFSNFKSLSSKQDKGHMNQFRIFVERVQQGGRPMIPFSSLVNTTRASFAAIESLKKRAWVNL